MLQNEHLIRRIHTMKVNSVISKGEEDCGQKWNLLDDNERNFDTDSSDSEDDSPEESEESSSSESSWNNLQ